MCIRKTIISKLSEDLLEQYTGKPLIDKYDMYQHLMDYWVGDDAGRLLPDRADGWKAETYRIIEKDKNGKEKDKGLGL
jgi:type I restriction enzyme M protein